MNLNVWQGKKVRLRAGETEDWEFFHTWHLDSEMARACYAIPFPTSEARDLRWASDMASKEAEKDAFFFAIQNQANELVGSINTTNCDLRYGTFGYGLAIRRQHQRQGYASEAILLVLRYFFQELRYQKVNAVVYDFNQPSIALHERLGFQQEGRLRRMGFSNGRHFDHILFGMTNEEFIQNYPAYLPPGLIEE